MAEQFLRLLLRDGMIADESRGAVSDLCIDLDAAAARISHERENRDDGLDGTVDAFALLGLENDPELLEYLERVAFRKANPSLVKGGRRPVKK